ncbi:MAG: carboxylating nicotinate-nucleotide diphosphorylase, partial [Promethearchaeota archaeon]
MAKSEGIVAGLDVARVLFEMLGVETVERIQDGRLVEEGKVVLLLRGPTRQVLAGERTALNIMMRMSAIATTTAHLVQLVQECSPDHPVRVACTRKTTPGFRIFEKEAVKVGGGDTHRWNLDDSILLKDTHLALTGSNVGSLVEGARGLASFTKKI